MTFAELKAELLARGFNYLGDTRAGVYINDALQELDGMFPWPYREKSASGAAPLTITDLGTVETVTMTGTSVPLAPMSFQALTSFGDLSVSGTPHSYYVAWPAGTPVVSVYPTSADSIDVQYWKVTPTLSGVQTPLAPTAFHSLIVDIAQRNAYYDKDNPDAAEALQRKVDRRVGQMVDQLLGGQTAQGPSDFQHLTGQSIDG